MLKPNIWLKLIKTLFIFISFNKQTVAVNFPFLLEGNVLFTSVLSVSRGPWVKPCHAGSGVCSTPPTSGPLSSTTFLPSTVWSLPSWWENDWFTKVWTSFLLFPLRIITTEHRALLHRILATQTPTTLLKLILFQVLFHSPFPHSHPDSLTRQVSPSPPSRCYWSPTAGCSWWRRGRGNKPCWTSRSRRSQSIPASTKQNKWMEEQLTWQTLGRAATVPPSAPMLFPGRVFCLCLSEARQCSEL